MGTASFVTDDNSETTQFFLNLPFGETMLEQQTGVYDNPYKFNAKELDSETGLYYYGARYYNPRISTWLGVDPLGEKMPSWSPYAYSFDNPVRYTDPDGMAPMDSGPGDRWGQMTISTSVDRKGTMISGHAWIVLTDNKGNQMSMSLWGNTGAQEFQVNKELGNYPTVTSRTVSITEAQADKIIQFNNKSENVDWTIVNDCAGYSGSLWESVTGESLNPYNILGVGVPANLADNIYSKNGNNNSNVWICK